MKNKKALLNRSTTDGVRFTSVGQSVAQPDAPELLLILTDIAVAGPGALIVGNSGQATASGFMRANTIPGITDDYPMTVASFTWSTSNPNVATVSATGLVTAVAQGTVTISAVATGSTSPVGTLSVGVTTPTPTLISIAVTPSNVSLNVGGTQQFVATGLYSDNQQSTPSPLVWDFSSGTTYASIGATGLVTAISSFTTVVVRATSGNTVGSVQMAVYSSATTVQGVVPVYSGTFANYADTDAMLADWNGTQSFAKNLTGFFGGYQNQWETNMGRTSSWRTEAYALVADSKFTKVARMGQWGRDLYQPQSVNTNGSGPTGKLRVDLPSTLSNYWCSRYVRFQDAADAPAGSAATGWSALNDGTSFAYKLLADNFVGSTAPNGLQFRFVVNLTQTLATDWHNHASFTESLLTRVGQSGAGNAIATLTSSHISSVNNDNGWWHFVNFYQRKSATEYVIGWWCRRAFSRAGATLGVAPFNAASGSTIHQWYTRICRYTRASGTIVAPLGVNATTNGENMNSTISRSQFVYWTPPEIVDGDQYPDPYGLLALFSVTP